MLAKAKSQALRFLAFRQRSIHEIRRFLTKKGHEEKIVKEVINYLKELGYLNDYQFSQLWIEDRIRLKPMGKRRIYNELLIKGIEPEIIKEALENSFNEAIEKELASSLVKKRMGNCDSQEKMARFLYSRGFAAGIIKETITQNYINNGSN